LDGVVFKIMILIKEKTSIINSLKDRWFKNMMKIIKYMSKTSKYFSN